MPFVVIAILRKTIEGYLSSFYFITFEKTFSNKSMFVSDRTTNMQCSRIQNEIYGSVVTGQYHAKCNNPPYPNVTSKNLIFALILFAKNLIWSLLSF